MEAILLTLALTATPYTTCEIVYGDDRNSQILLSEYSRKQWSLGCLAHEIDCTYEVRWTHRIDNLYRGETPAVFVGSRKLGVIKPLASGDALISLHEMLANDAKECRELIDAKRFDFSFSSGWRFGEWNDDGTLAIEKFEWDAVPAPPAEDENEE